MAAVSDRILVVMFDLDDTLFAHRESVDAGITAHRTTLGGRLGGADATAEAVRWHDLEEHHYTRYLRGELDISGQRRARVRDFVAPYGIELDDRQSDDWFWTYFAQYQRAWELHSDVSACLDDLESRGIRIGLITNGDLEFQGRKIDALALGPRLEQVITSSGGRGDEAGSGDLPHRVRGLQRDTRPSLLRR